MSHTDDNQPHPLDIALGGRIRTRRKELEMSQYDLALQIGVTFQQVQKYEHGANRVSFSRLIEIAQALKCSAADLIGPLDVAPAQHPVFLKQMANLAQPGAAELLEGFAAIPTPGHRTSVLRLVRTLAEQNNARAA